MQMIGSIRRYVRSDDQIAGSGKRLLIGAAIVAALALGVIGGIASGHSGAAAMTNSTGDGFPIGGVPRDCPTVIYVPRGQPIDLLPGCPPPIVVPIDNA